MSSSTTNKGAGQHTVAQYDGMTLHRLLCLLPINRVAIYALCWLLFCLERQ